jgi:hypothetical protein
MLATASVTVGRLSSSRCDSAEPTLAKKLSPSWGTPSTLPSCPAAISSPVPALKPACTGAEMKSATNPSRSSPASSSSPPASTARVDAATGTLAGSPAAAAATAAAVSADSVEVVLTDSGREVPSSA